MRQGHDRFGNVVSPGDRAEIFRVAGGSTGGDALGWTGGIPGTVREVDSSGWLLVELDERSSYPPPYDIKREWSAPTMLVKR